MSVVSNIFNELRGKWELHRTISPGGIYEGQAIFTPITPTEMQYREEGVFTLDNAEIITSVKKSYAYKLENGQIAVYFDDGQEKANLFHSLKFETEKSATAEHLCINDFYKTVYEFNLPESFSIQHSVNGPKKNYISMSVYKKL